MSEARENRAAAPGGRLGLSAPGPEMQRRRKGLLAKELSAEQALLQMGLDILSEEELSEYNAHRFDDGDLRPEAHIGRLGWEDHAGMSKRQFYVRDPEGVEAGVLRTAWFYPEGTTESGGVPAMVIEDAQGREIAERVFAPGGERERRVAAEESEGLEEAAGPAKEPKARRGM